MRGPRTTAIFPGRTLQSEELTTTADPHSLRAWQETPAGQAFYDALAVHVAERVRLRAGRLLSVGEGDGALASRLARLLPGVEVVGLDLSAEAVDAAAARHRADNLRFEQGSAADLARHGPFAGVVSVQAFHHFADPRAALRGMFDALAPGGALLVIDLRRDADLAAYRRRIEGYVAMDSWSKARLLRASVAAAHTLPELAAMARELAPAAGVRPLALTRAARAAYARVDAGSLAQVEADLRGLMLELRTKRPTPGRAPARDRARAARAASRAPSARAGAGTLLWSAGGALLWADPAALALTRQCRPGWRQALAADALAVASDAAGARTARRDLPLAAGGGAVRARSMPGPAAAGVAAVTVLEPARRPRLEVEPRSAALAAQHRLTARELEVLAHVAEGLGSRQIAQRLGIATPTVCTHLTSIYRKTRTSGRVELVRLALGGPRLATPVAADPAGGTASSRSSEASRRARAAACTA
ncbi:MAG: methyltransferase domain-containing protein [Planctomycetes bacterium]|nr:methyltransferase domain-containing protein [Planctomycetota bacterium]